MRLDDIHDGIRCDFLHKSGIFANAVRVPHDRDGCGMVLFDISLRAHVLRVWSDRVFLSGECHFEFIF